MLSKSVIHASRISNIASIKKLLILLTFGTEYLWSAVQKYLVLTSMDCGFMMVLLGPIMCKCEKFTTLQLHSTIKLMATG